MDRDWWLVTRGDVTLKVAILTALFCSLGVALYTTMEIEPVPIVALSLFYAPLVAVVLWLQKDTRRTGVGAIQDWGYFLLIAWPILIPWYAFRTRGRSGWRLALGLLGLANAPSVTALVLTSVVW